MPERILRGVGIFMFATGFILWAYGFVYSSFWYANTAASILEPLRVWLFETANLRLSPGVTEEAIGLITAFHGIVLQIRSYYGKGS